MKKLFTISILFTFLLSNLSIADSETKVFLNEDGSRPVNTFYSSTSKVAHIPVVEIDGVPILSDIKLKLREDGLFELVDFRNYDETTDHVESETVEKIVEVEKIVYVDRVVEKEICSSSSSSTTLESFIVESSLFSVGDVYTTKDGDLITITGTRSSYCDKCGVEFGSVFGSKEATFNIAPGSLPEATNGKKGAYYLLWNGDIAYADFL